RWPRRGHGPCRHRLRSPCDIGPTRAAQKGCPRLDGWPPPPPPAAGLGGRCRTRATTGRRVPPPPPPRRGGLLLSSGGRDGLVGENGAVAETGRSPRLTPDEVALVLRRAAEIEAASDGTVDDEGLDAAAVEEAAREAGLSPLAVRQAVAELQVGALPVAPATRNGGLTASRFVSEQRLVDSAPEIVHAKVDRFM